MSAIHACASKNIRSSTSCITNCLYAHFSAYGSPGTSTTHDNTPSPTDVSDSIHMTAKAESVHRQTYSNCPTTSQSTATVYSHRTRKNEVSVSSPSPKKSTTVVSDVDTLPRYCYTCTYFSISCRTVCIVITIFIVITAICHVCKIFSLKYLLHVTFFTVQADTPVKVTEPREKKKVVKVKLV